MKKIKIVSMLLSALMLISLLTGCVCANLSITVNKDGSGSFAMFSGFTKEGLAIISGVDVTEITDDVLSDFQQYEYNNKTYYGAEMFEPFASTDELCRNFQAENSEMSLLSFEKIDGGYIMSFDLTESESLGKEIAEDEIGTTEELTDAEVKEILKEMAVILEINYPEGKISRLDRRGNVPGLTQVTDSCYRIDLVEFSLAETGMDCLKFALTDGETDVEVPEIVRFDDVDENEWYYTAITEIAASGVVKGVGDNKFNPEGTLTYAEFCQMVYNTTGINPLVEHGYWAYVAIENALNNGFIKSLGDITEENYDVPISREEAIVALYRVINSDMNFGKPVGEYKVVEGYSIPDLAEISSQYAEEVNAAYKLGLTKGSDELGTFYPKNSLTRAEMCQLFYNIMNK